MAGAKAQIVKPFAADPAVENTCGEVVDCIRFEMNVCATAADGCAVQAQSECNQDATRA